MRVSGDAATTSPLVSRGSVRDSLPNDHDRVPSPHENLDKPPSTTENNVDEPQRPGNIDRTFVRTRPHPSAQIDQRGSTSSWRRFAMLGMSSSSPAATAMITT